MKAGDKEHSIENYKKSLQKDPWNENAKEKIKQMEPPQTTASGSGI